MAPLSRARFRFKRRHGVLRFARSADYDAATRKGETGDETMTRLTIKAGPYVFGARLETALAPKTCESFMSRLPFESQVVHVRWSGEAVWIPLGEMDFKVGYENNTSYPAPGQIILYPGGLSETEILIGYGGVRFASKVGQLSGSHFLTIDAGLEHIADLGKMTLWKGAQPIRFELAE